MKKIITLLVLLFAFQMNAQCWQKISAGSSHTLGLKADGTLWAWGHNDTGQLGIGNTNNKSIPTRVGTGTNWVYVSASYDTSFAIKADGTLWGWGENTFYRIGDGTPTNRTAPVQIGTATNWLSVDSKNHTVAIKTDGTLWAWGFNSTGQLGNGTSSNDIYVTTPVQVGTDTNWSAACAGSDATIALKNNGTLWACGDNDYGQLGNGLSGNNNLGNPLVLVLTQIGTATDWQKISLGNTHNLAVKTNGTLWAWGKNDIGQLGDGTTSLKNIPTQIGTGTDWNKVSATSSHSLAVKTDGTLWAWGNNNYGQIGDGTTVNKTTPTQIGTATNWSETFSRGQLSVAIKTDGSFYGWGYNSYGQLGDATTAHKNTPTAIACPVTLSSEDFSDLTSFSVYPNPANDFISIKNDSNLSIEFISIIDLTGKKVFEQKGNISSINVQQLESGLYIIQITSEGKSHLSKFIKG
ncbi:RCC1 domain-containing protein [Flavobacterium terrigena]|uniref:Por secretion system C-terminal sorting domain-containing protein n=1 Tax=Flavobacterium terrigena TaxID=402734 RepID=A0A1H6QFZ9_9FLAO|nr:T9SS type A sorting domain-containing protein [Flavobacterium terrigena]SEI40776.1 Por secretion system C-terminal sorting domain-containing protein [Flavobacterium terrigena]